MSIGIDKTIKLAYDAFLSSNKKTMKNNMITKLGLMLVTTALLLTGCFQEETPVEEVVIPPKQVETFEIGAEAPLFFTKTGQASSSQSAVVLPQIVGSITEVKTKVGDKVQEGDLLLTLGDSLSTTATQLNYETAVSGIKILHDTEFKTNYAAQVDVESATMAYFAARAGLENAITTKENSKKIYDEQSELLEDQIDDLKKLVNKLREIPGFQNNPTYIETKALYNQLRDQEDIAELGQEAQEDQLDYAIEMGRQQLKSAFLTVENVQVRYSIQFMQLNSSILQAKSGRDLLQLQIEAKNIKAPITGIVTSIQAKEGNQTAPGQVLLTIETLNELTISTSVNQDELSLIAQGDTVTIEGNSKTCKGTITEVSPTLSSFNGKANIEITLPKNSPILSGELVDITFAPNTDSIYIPLATVTIEDSSYSVKVIVSGKKIEKRQVQPGIIIGNYIEILDGLNPGDTLAVAQNTFLKEGDKVTYKIPVNR